jgi:hypothetical protein
MPPVANAWYTITNNNNGIQILTGYSFQNGTYVM